MWRRVLFLALCIALPVEGEALIFGPDDRVIQPSQEGSLFAPVGIVIGGSVQSYATAFLISSCHAMTVRHAFGLGASVIGAKTTFAANVAGSPEKWIKTPARVVEAGLAPLSAHSFSTDWAILKLDRCLGTEFGSVILDARTPVINAQVEIAGYPNDRSLTAGLSVDRNCVIKAFENGMALHDCATQPGNSGSPIFRVAHDGSSERLYVVAMNTSGHFYGVPGANLKLPVTEFYPSYASSALPVMNMLRSRSPSKPLRQTH